MNRFPPSLEYLIREFKQLPGIGEKTAERFVFHLLRRGHETRSRLSEAILNLDKNIRTCAVCQSISEDDPCRICSDPRRNSAQLCIVADHQGQAAIEKTGSYAGKYYILGGLLSPIEGITPDTLGISRLDQRLQQWPVEEMILAMNPTIEGEATMVYLSKRYSAGISNISRLARGLPRGADLEYADDVTLSDALQGRMEIKKDRPF